MHSWFYSFYVLSVPFLLVSWKPKMIMMPEQVYILVKQTLQHFGALRISGKFYFYFNFDVILRKITQTNNNNINILYLYLWLYLYLPQQWMNRSSMITFQNIIPISLYVSIEFVKTFQVWYKSWQKKKGYWNKTNSHVVWTFFVSMRKLTWWWWSSSSSIIYILGILYMEWFRYVWWNLRYCMCTKICNFFFFFSHHTSRISTVFRKTNKRTNKTCLCYH